MIKLENIRKNGKIIRCDLLPEDSRETGTVSVNTASETLESYTLPKGYEWCKSHVHQAKRALLELAKLDEIPKKHTVMWY